jgi:hypothetical protein
VDSKVKPTHEQRPRPAGLLAHLEVRPIEVEVAEAGVLALGEATELPVTWAQMLLVNRLSAAYGLRPPRLRASAVPLRRRGPTTRAPTPRRRAARGRWSSSPRNCGSRPARRDPAQPRERRGSRDTVDLTPKTAARTGQPDRASCRSPDGFSAPIAVREGRSYRASRPTRGRGSDPQPEGQRPQTSFAPRFPSLSR